MYIFLNTSKYLFVDLEGALITWKIGSGLDTVNRSMQTIIIYQNQADTMCLGRS